MIQMQTIVEVADNSGAKTARCVKVLGGAGKKVARVGDIVVIAVQNAVSGGKVKKGDVKKAVIVRSKYTLRREDGSYISFDKNSAVILSSDKDPLGTRIFGPVARELRSLGFVKICSLAPEVL